MPFVRIWFDSHPGIVTYIKLTCQYRRVLSVTTTACLCVLGTGSICLIEICWRICIDLKVNLSVP